MNSTALLSAIAAAAMVSGCALTTDRIDIAYQETGAVPVSGARSVTVAVDVLDQRPDKAKVGSKKNGYGMEMAPIVASEDVGITIQRAFARELKARGFEVEGRPTIQVAAEITLFVNDFKIGFFAGDAVADLIISVSVKSSTGAQLFSRQLVSQGVEQNIQLASGENAKLALERALSNAMKTLFDDQGFIAALLGSSRASL